MTFSRFIIRLHKQSDSNQDNNEPMEMGKETSNGPLSLRLSLKKVRIGGVNVFSVCVEVFVRKLMTKLCDSRDYRSV